MTNGLLTLSVARPRLNAEETLKTYELFIYGDLNYIINSVCKTLAKFVNFTLYNSFR